MDWRRLARWSPLWLRLRSTLIPLGMAAVAVAVVVLFRGGGSGVRHAFPVTTPTPTETPALQVHIAGAVQQPGVYSLQDGARIDDLLRLAGGPAPDADLAAVNLATRLRDAQQIIIPRVGEASAATTARPGQANLVNLNTASQALLETLPDIGEVRARRIIESRTQDGPFREPRDLVSRQIITERILTGIQDRITVQ